MSNFHAMLLLNQFLSECTMIEEKARNDNNSAVDIEDDELRVKTQEEAYRKIRKIKDWKGIINTLKEDIEKSDIFNLDNDNTEKATQLNEKPVQPNISSGAEEKTFVIPNEPQNKTVIIEEEPDEQIGEYVRNKMKLLCEVGYYFTENEIEVMSNKLWSQRVLGLNYPFIRIYDKTKEISQQTKDEKGYNRFWKQVFDFKFKQLLISSQWYLHNKEKFDIWYNSLDKQSRIMGNVAPTLVAPKNEPEEQNKKNYYQPEEYTGEEPVSVELFGRKYFVKQWNELYIKVLEVLLLKRPYVIAKLDKNTELNSEQRTNFSYNPDEIKFNKKRLSNGLYIETNKSAKDIVRTCEKLLKLCDCSIYCMKIVYSKEK